MLWDIDFTTDGTEVVKEDKTETFRGRLKWRENDLFLDSTNICRFHHSRTYIESLPTGSVPSIFFIKNEWSRLSGRWIGGPHPYPRR